MKYTAETESPPVGKVSHVNIADFFQNIMNEVSRSAFKFHDLHARGKCQYPASTVFCCVWLIQQQ